MDDLFESDVLSRLQALNEVQPHMPLWKALSMVQSDPEGFDNVMHIAEITKSMPTVPSYENSSPDIMGSYVAWVREHFPKVQEYANQSTMGADGKVYFSKTIHAIKELRSHTGIGLKEAKEIVLFMRDPNYQPSWWGPSSKAAGGTHMHFNVSTFS